MAERSGFFNALRIDGGYDRTYNANDYSDNLAVVISNGVLRSNNDDLRVTASGMVCTVGAGRAWINGKYYYNDAPKTFAAVTAPAGGSRWDRIMLRLDNTVTERRIALRYVQGVAANTPTKPVPVQNSEVYELVLADIYVGTNATSVIVTDTRSDANLCGWVYSTAGDNSFFTTLDNDYNTWSKGVKDNLASVTLFKRYAWRTITDGGLTASVGFNIPQWDEETCFLDVFVNGIRVVEGVDFTREGRMLLFPNLLQAGTEIDVAVYKSIDGTGIMSVADEITQLQNQVAMLAAANDYAYVCNGYDDNVQLSRIATEWLEGGSDYSSKTIRVYGTFGAHAPVGGDGGFFSPYEWIRVAGENHANRKIIFDFSCCSQLTFPVIAGAPNYIFAGIDAHIIGADINCYEKTADTTSIALGSVGIVYAENCRFWLTGYTTCKVAVTGTFTNCRASVANTVGESYCFTPLSSSLLRVNGGEYMAYSGSASIVSAVVGHQASATEAVSILNGVNAPTWGRGGYYQTNAIKQYSGAGTIKCHDLVSALPVDAIYNSEIVGTITRSKANAG